MKITLEFENMEDAESYLNGPKYRGILFDLRNALREDTKHGEGKHTEIYDLLFSLCNSESLDAWEL